MQTLLVSLGAYGAVDVRRHGQARFAQLALEAGADGVEVRAELLQGTNAELAELRGVVERAGAPSVFSSPHGLWNADGVLDEAALARALNGAQAIGARRVKMSMGGFSAASGTSFARMARTLEGRRIELLIENDQTAGAGTLLPLVRFFGSAQAAGLPLGMTFDMGNWHWNGECALEAARACAGHVAYVHCKGVQRQPQRWVAVPLVDSYAPWRAVLRALPRGCPWAIEYPLQGDDLLAVTGAELARLRAIAATLEPIP